MIAHLSGLFVDQGCPIHVDDSGNINDTDCSDDQFDSFDLDIDSTVTESYSSMVQDVCVLFSSSSDSSPESVIVSSQLSPSVIRVGVGRIRQFFRLLPRM
jgi:hypothetical protein